MDELKKYVLVARQKFLTDTKDYEQMMGNDNIIGRIGEFVALDFLTRQGRKVNKNKNRVEKGFNLLCKDSDKISVKLITAENKYGRTTRLKDTRTEFILITLDEGYKVERIGHMRKDELLRAVEAKFLRNAEPLADRKMTNDGGLFERFGRLYKGDDVKGYL